MLFEVFGAIVHKNYFWFVVLYEPLAWIPTICIFVRPSVIVRYLGITLKLTVINIHGPLLEGVQPEYNVFKSMNRVSIANITFLRESNHYCKVDSISYNMIIFLSKKQSRSHFKAASDLTIL